jgi:hypothetical protein
MIFAISPRLLHALPQNIWNELLGLIARQRQRLGVDVEEDVIGDVFILLPRVRGDFDLYDS